MSGVLVQAGKMGTPVIAGSDGLIGHLTTKYGNGIVMPTMDRETVVQSIRYLVQNPVQVSRYVEKGKRAYEKHSIAAAVDSIAEVLLRVPKRGLAV